MKLPEVADVECPRRRRKSIHQIWKIRGSGLVVPDGTISDLSLSSSYNLLQINQKALALEQLYANANVQMHRNTDLAQLIADVRALSDSSLSDRANGIHTTQLFRVLNLDRIADAVLPLRDVPDPNRFLRALLSGSVSLLDRKESNAKDTLWELDLWTTLKRRPFNAVLKEPPDIVIDSRVGIACKKLYSVKNVEKVLSEAVTQIEGNFDLGIVAINLDDVLVPPEQILSAATQEMAIQHIRDLNMCFLRSHERHLRKYLAPGRLMSALVSTSVLADIEDCFSNFRQRTVWTIPGLPFEKDRELKAFYARLMA